jgi:osmoprotectant transport system substrate-binding protein
MRKFYYLLLLLLVGMGWVACGTAAAAKSVVVGSTNFTEQLVLANIYTDVLKAHHIPVKQRLNLGSREVVFPALKAGELDILPEYTGALLDYLTKGKSKKHTPQAVLKALRAHLPKSIVALKPSSAQDKDALVVTQKTAKQYHLKTISDLRPVASKLTAGGPPEDKTRYVGLPGLKQVYGVQFAGFKSLDAGGPLTTGALSSGAIDVARMFTTEGIIQAKGWVVLKDDKHLVPADNIIPVVRKAILTPTIRKALNAVSNTLTTQQLRTMNKRVTIDKTDPEIVAHDWVQKHHFGKAN